MKKMRRIISKTNDGCNFQLTESSVIAFSRAHGLWKIFQSIFVLSRKKSRYQSELTYGVSFRILVSFRFRSPFQSSITPILPSFSLCKLTYLPPSLKKRCCIVIPWTFSYKQATLGGWGGFVNECGRNGSIILQMERDLQTWSVN